MRNIFVGLVFLLAITGGVLFTMYPGETLDFFSPSTLKEEPNVTINKETQADLEETQAALEKAKKALFELQNTETIRVMVFSEDVNSGGILDAYKQVTFEKRPASTFEKDQITSPGINKDNEFREKFHNTVIKKNGRVGTTVYRYYFGDKQGVKEDVKIGEILERQYLGCFKFRMGRLGSFIVAGSYLSS